MQAIEVRGPRLNSTKKERATKTYGIDKRLDSKIIPALPLLQVSGIWVFLECRSFVSNLKYLLKWMKSSALILHLDNSVPRTFPKTKVELFDCFERLIAFIGLTGSYMVWMDQVKFVEDSL